MSTLLKCPICGGTERSLLPSSVCEECGCDMRPDASDARRVLFDKSQPKEARMAAMNVLQPKPAEAREPVGDAVPSLADAARDLLRLKDGPRDDAYFQTKHIAWDNLRRALAQPRDTPRDSGDARDAARYRFLRDPKNSIVYAMDWVNWNEVPHSGRSHFRYEEPEQLDSAIDAQLAAMQSPTGEPT